MLHEITHTFLTLVPKSLTSSSLSDYRPISCCNILYKFITKVLANRLQVVIGELISRNQCAFLEDKSISDCTLFAHELARDFKKPMGSRLCLKINLKKAFDSVNRDFVLYIMKCMGFPPTWCHWIKELIYRPSFSVMINGSPGGFFKSNRGIRQGDPLSPFIFVMVMEFLSIHMQLPEESGNIKPLK